MAGALDPEPSPFELLVDELEPESLLELDVVEPESLLEPDDPDLDPSPLDPSPLDDPDRDPESFL